MDIATEPASRNMALLVSLPPVTKPSRIPIAASCFARSLSSSPRISAACPPWSASLASSAVACFVCVVNLCCSSALAILTFCTSCAAAISFAICFSLALFLVISSRAPAESPATRFVPASPLWAAAVLARSFACILNSLPLAFANNSAVSILVLITF